MNKHCRPLHWLVTAYLFLFPLLGSAQDLILTAPPREKPEVGVKEYGPLAEYLSRLLGAPVKYVHPGNWLNYQRDMREDKYDIVFDGPHFASWRIAHLGHEVLVRLPGTLQFILFADKNDNEINSTDDLIGKKICGLAPPNLATMSVIATFNNPVRQPVVQAVTGGMPAVYKSFSEGKCRAGVVRDTFYKNKLTPEQRAQLKVIFQPEPLPNQSITVSKRVDARGKSLIRQSLTNGDGVKVSQVIVQRFGGKNANAFIPAKAEEFDGINGLLEGVIFGW